MNAGNCPSLAAYFKGMVVDGAGLEHLGVDFLRWQFLSLTRQVSSSPRLKVTGGCQFGVRNWCVLYP